MTEQERAETRQEAKILALLKHPCIVNFREVYTTVSNKLCIVMDFAEGGDLQKKIKDNRGRLFPEAQILDWFAQICLGMKHVHDRKILHRDIKAQNVFMTATNRCLLGDFGIARVLKNTKGFAKTMVGTPYYLSPEIIESKHYGFKSDIWSLGVLLYEMCALKPPFDGPSLHFLAMKIVKGAYTPLPAQYSRELKSLVAQMLTIDPNKRPSIHQILNSNIIKNRIRSFLSEAVYSAEFSHTILHNVNVLDNKENKALVPPSMLPAVKAPAAKYEPPMRSPINKGAPLPSARGGNPYVGGLRIPPPPMFGAHGANRDRDLERMRLERERQFRVKEKEAAEKKKQEELERRRAEELERKRVEELERKRMEDLERKRLDEEKKRLDDEKRRIDEEKRIFEEEKHRASEERKKQERLKEEAKPSVLRTPRVVASEDPLLGRPKFSPAVVVPISQPIVTKNARINQIKANFDRQIGFLKGEKKRPDPKAGNHRHHEASNGNAKGNHSVETGADEKLRQVDEARKAKAHEREELRKKMRDDIKEQRKKISPAKLDPDVQWTSGSASERKEHPAPAVPVAAPMTPNGNKKIDPALMVPVGSEEESKQVGKQKQKKSGKTKLKSKKRKSVKKPVPEMPQPPAAKPANEVEEIKEPLVPVQLSENAAGDIAKAQKEINNYMLLRQEMEKIMTSEEIGKTPGGPDDEDCGDIPAVKCSQDNNEKDQGRDDVAGVLEEEKEAAGKTPMGAENMVTDPGPAAGPSTKVEAKKEEDEREVVKSYLVSKFGRENVQGVLAGMRRLLV